MVLGCGRGFEFGIKRFKGQRVSTSKGAPVSFSPDGVIGSYKHTELVLSKKEREREFICWDNI